MKSLLVVGGTGFIGHHIIKEAKKKNFSITSISLNKIKKKKFHKGVKYIRADISNIKNLKKKINKKFDYVINAGGYGEHPDYGKEGDKLIKSHFYGLINILKVLPLGKIKKFIQIGSSAEYGLAKSPLKENINCKPNSPYSFAKLSSTYFLINLYKKKKFPVTILRLFQVYGSGQDNNRILPFLINNCIKDKKFLTTKGEQLCDFCHIEDIVKAIFKSLSLKKIDGEIINLGSGKPIKIKFLINLVKKLVGKGKPKFGGLKYKKDTNMKNFPSVQKAKKKLNWSPKVDLIQGLTRTINSYK